MHDNGGSFFLQKQSWSIDNDRVCIPEFNTQHVLKPISKGQINQLYWNEFINAKFFITECKAVCTTFSLLMP